MLLQESESKLIHAPAAQGDPPAEDICGSSTPWWVKMPAERQTEVLCNAVLAAQELYKGYDTYEMLHDSFGMTDEELADIVPELVREYGAQGEGLAMRMGGA